MIQQHFPSYSSKISQEEEAKKENDDIISPTTDIIEDSVYEDAIGGKPTPIMNSTLKYNTVVPENMLNATVVIQPLQQKKLNETVVIQKAPKEWNSRENSRERISLRNIQQSNDKAMIEDNIIDTYNNLITDDESSPELKKSRKHVVHKQKKPILSSSDEDDIVSNTPVKKQYFKEPSNVPLVTQEVRTHKPNALFSPYAKESVKKKVEAFEQVVNQSPKSVDINVPTRVTRTKTRAMARAAAAEAEAKKEDKNYTQILARKSLAKAKKIACLVGKQNEENKEHKEVNISVSKC